MISETFKKIKLWLLLHNAETIYHLKKGSKSTIKMVNDNMINIYI